MSKSRARGNGKLCLVPAVLAAATGCILSSAAALAVELVAPGRPSLNFYGVTGLIDTPTAESQPDATLSVSLANFAGSTRTTLSFQITPRLSGSFRYTGIRDWNFNGFPTYYDRSFDLRYQVLQEGKFLPAVTVGLQDFLGTGLYSGEYIVATKRIARWITVSGGIGWGRLGDPAASRFGAGGGRGGTVDIGNWFQGEPAAFGGIEITPTERLSFKAEYSPDKYVFENTSRTGLPPIFARKSPWNYGVEYQISNSTRIGAYYLYGSEVGIAVNIAFNPKNPPNGDQIEPAPLPVKPRAVDIAAAATWDTTWIQAPQIVPQLRNVMSQVLALDGILVEAMSVTANRAEIRIINTKFDNEPQAIGRTVRAMTQVMPASVEVFTVIPVVNGVPLSSVTVRRSDVEAYENAPAGTEMMLAHAQIDPVIGVAPRDQRAEGLYPRFTWGLGPYARFSYFDPDNPIRADAGVRLRGRYEPVPGLVFSGSAVKKVVGNLDSSTRVSDSVLPRVRSDLALYDKQGDPAIETLTAAYYFKPGRDLYGRVTAGYLEGMFGGVSAELLWKPVNSRLALGAEVNYVKQRNFDQMFGFQAYQVGTGHVSAYYEFGGGFVGQIDAGRYLAGDYGATISLDRVFANGWKVGAFATLTDVSFDDFGEGSFDKGLRIEIPFSWFTGKPTQETASVLIRPVTRDGGARLNVDGRLFETVSEYHRRSLTDEWGRFWR